MSESEMLNMSDEDFAKLTSAPAVEVQQEQQPQPDPVETAPVATEEQQPAAVVKDPVVTEETNPEVTPPAAEATPPATPELDAEGNPVEPVVEDAPDYKAMYEELAKPVTIKANGKEIQLKDHKELVQLAQQGANYTRKMQELAPHRKTLLMLENNGIDQEKLDFLISVSKKDPAAIQKLLKDSGVNPLDIDTEAEPTFKGGNHTVSDAEANFREALDHASSSEDGQFVLQAIKDSWDQASKELLYKQPAVIQTMVQQKAEGFYDRIVDEMDRQRILGALPAGQTWLESYKQVGEAMVAAGSFADILAKGQQPQQTSIPAAAPVATRVLTPKPQVAASAAAAAAAPSRAAAKPAQKLTNPLELDDAEFMKQFANRL